MLLSPTRAWLRWILSWSAAGSGMLLGLLALVLCGQGWIGRDPSSPEWLTNRLGVAWLGLVGLTFLIASSAALRSRSRASRVFLIGLPISGLWLGCSSAGYWTWDVDGGGSFHPLALPTVAGLSCLFYASLAASPWVIRNRRRAVSVLSAVAILAVLVLTVVLLPLLAVFSAVFLAFGGFWLETSKRGWPALLAVQPRSVTKRLAFVAVVSIAAAALVVAGNLVLVAMRSSLFTGDGSGPHLFVRPVRPGHAVFTARVVWTGHVAKVKGRWAGKWAIGLVQEHFWGLPSWAPRLVLLTNYVFVEGQTLFVSGSRDGRMLPGLLPIVDAELCGDLYALPLTYAKMQLQVLRKPPPAGEARIMGYVQSALPPVRLPPVPRGNDLSAAYEWAFSIPPRYRPLAGARVRVTGSSETRIVTTDGSGTYVAAGLKPGSYTLTLLDVPANQIARDCSVTKEEMMRRGLFRLDIRAEWLKNAAVPPL